MMINNKLGLLSLIMLLLSACSQTTPEQSDLTSATSREYKLMLSANAFNDEKKAVKQYFKEMKRVITLAIKADVKGKVKLSSELDVTFYDTPGSCTLKNNGYSFRERVKVKNGKSKVSLKYRSTDLNKALKEDVSSSLVGAKSKFELDIGVNNTNKITSIYSASTKHDNTRLINNMKDINSAFPAFKAQYKFNNNTVIVPVGGLTANERVYEGLNFNLGGNTDAKISLTLWYQKLPFLNSEPLVAEVSFSFANDKGIYPQAVLERAEKAFRAMQKMEAWSATYTETKTQFVYNFTPDFCSEK